MLKDVSSAATNSWAKVNYFIVNLLLSSM